MKAISVKQPWASLIALGIKKIECRSWNTKYRGDLLICASKTTQFEKDTTKCGKALAVVKVVEVRCMTENDLLHAFIPKELQKKALQGYAWILEKQYEVIPIAIKGKLSFYEVNESLLTPLPQSYKNHLEYLQSNQLNIL